METDFGFHLKDEVERIPEFILDENIKYINLYDWQKKGIDFFFKKKKVIFQCPTGCISGDTFIELPRDLIKYPKGIPIKELVRKKDFYVYSFNVNTHKIELKKAIRAWKSGNKDVYEIKLLSGKIIKATSNHLFLTSIRKKPGKGSGRGIFKREKVTRREYKAVSDLKIGDYVTVFNRQFIMCKDGGLIKTDYNCYQRRILEHRFIMEQLKGKLGIYDIVHHKDENRYNNSVENLDIMDMRIHSRYHTIKKGFYGKALWENKGHPKGMLGKHHTEYTKTIISKNMKAVWNNLDFIPIKKEQSEWEKDGFLSDCCKIKKIESCKKCSYTLKRKSKKELAIRASYGYVRYNERIINIKYVGKEDVYDMEVEDNHNFIANNFVIHNSGKSIFAIEIIKRILKEKPESRILIVVPKNVILETTWFKSLYENGYSMKDVGTYYGDIKEYGKITITNMQSVDNIAMELFNVLIIDECFSGDTEVMVLDSYNNMTPSYRYTSIKNLVKNKSTCLVPSFNIKKQKIEHKPIIGWYEIEKEREVVDIKFEDGRKITATPEQLFFNGEKYVKAIDMKIGDEVIMYKHEKVLIHNNDIKQVVLSGMIGDGCLSLHPSKGSARMSYSSIKKDYLIYKKNILESEGEKINFKKTVNRGYGEYIYTLTTKSYSDLKDYYFKYKKQGINFVLNQLDNFGIALWMFDDGSGYVNRNAFTLHCNRFSKKDGKKIERFFIGRGYDCVLLSYIKKQTNKKYYYINFRKKGFLKLKKIMRQYCVKSMRYKIK